MVKVQILILSLEMISLSLGQRYRFDWDDGTINNGNPMSMAVNFMKRFGYLEDEPSSSYTNNAIFNAVKEVQKFASIAQTGHIDNRTLSWMTAHRCGLPDVIKNDKLVRYSTVGTGWQKHEITYFLTNLTSKIESYVIEEEFRRALNVWSPWGQLTFTRVYDANADMVVLFATGYHGDEYPFDGEGGVLAHAFFPDLSELGGDVHFDDDEKWVNDPQGSTDGVDFFSVAVHELGHALGLAHSDDISSVMYPVYKHVNPGGALNPNDILSIYQLYGPGFDVPTQNYDF